ncbi:MAG: transcriptional repressor [Clostridiales bacterium]|nr:transcriptional repressor [Clostridiales bacterium]
MNRHSGNILKNMLRDGGYKLTPQRQAVYDVIAGHGDKHLKCEEIYLLLAAEFPRIGLATVYRTLGVLTEVGLLSKVNFDDGFLRYELNSSPADVHRHHHLICLRCGRIDEAVDDLMEELEKAVLEASGFQVEDHSVKMYGYCRSCRPHLDKA